MYNRIERLHVGMLLVFLQLLFGAVVLANDDEVEIIVRNPTADDIEVRWDDGSTDGKVVSGVAKNGQRSVNTYEGHGFKLTRTRAGNLEHVGSFTVTAGEKVYTVPGAAVGGQSPWSLSAWEEGLNKMREEHGAVSFLKSDGGQRDNLPMRMIIKNFRRYELERHWEPDDGRDIQFQGVISPMGREDGVTSYSGHVFRITKVGGSDVVARLVMNYDQRVYVIDPEPDDPETLQSAEYLKHLKEMEFRNKYKAENGIPWLGSYPAVPPSLPMHIAPAAGIGTRAHTVRIRGASRADGINEDSTLDLIALSSGPPEGPRAFMIKDLLTHDECDHIMSKSKHLLKRSTVGQDSRAKTQDTRTSDQVFIPKSTTPTIQVVHKRFADVLNVTDDQLNYAAEDLQVVRYKKGQQYAPHYDYSGTIDRMATLLIYLEKPSKEGGTSFPRAFDDRGLTIRPERGSAVLFYSRLDDGNLDELALHAGLPVKDGEKMVCNLWLHAHGSKHWRTEDQEL